MTEEHIKNSNTLKICADTNAVPPSGIAGVDVMDNGKVIGRLQVNVLVLVLLQ